VEIVDEILALDNEWKKEGFDLDQTRKELGKLQKELGALHKNKENPPSKEVLAEYLILNIKNKDTINLKNNTLRLQEIKCDSIKIIGNNNIKKIDLVNSFAKKIKISKCSKLEKIEIHDIKSNEIKIEKCKNIKIIDVCTEERIKKLIIQNNKKLKKISTFPSWGKISQIKLKKLKMLKYLDITGIPIKKINLSKYRKLKYVYLSYCKIKKVKIGKKNCIREIDLSHNKIKKINIRVLKKAYNIDVSYNKLKGRLVLPRLIHADANTIDCDNNKLKYIINPKNSCIWILCCNHNKLKTIDLNNAELDILECKKKSWGKSLLCYN